MCKKVSFPGGSKTLVLRFDNSSLRAEGECSGAEGPEWVSVTYDAASSAASAVIIGGLAADALIAMVRERSTRGTKIISVEIQNILGAAVRAAEHSAACLAERRYLNDMLH